MEPVEPFRIRESESMLGFKLHILDGNLPIKSSCNWEVLYAYGGLRSYGQKCLVILPIETLEARRCRKLKEESLLWV